MMEEQATVVAVEEGRVWVETIRSSACQTCSARAGCGQSLMGKVISNDTQAQKNYLSIPTERILLAGQAVLIGIPERAFLVGSFWLYLVPLLTLLIGALVFDALWGNDSMAFLGAIVGLAAGALVVRLRTQSWQSQPEWQPKILRVL
ncbi:SoxR reducing system RseC family protein [Salinispirillum marinum]|uniref:SoxR reducing system RseC family protein n=2 Tax=Saccharospirillaceae TaxID=255527 RepID=A0ABV8BH92_9GAMM